MKRIIKIILFICIAFYTFFLVSLYFFQNSLIYLPSQRDFYDCNYFTVEEKKEYKGTRFYERKGEKPGVIVFFHGNGGRACDRQRIAGIFEKTGYSYMLVEYSGYAEGDKSITPDISNVLQNVNDVQEYLETSGYKRIISAGRSIGTGPASLLAGMINSEKLLLFSPYSELYKVAVDKYRMFPVKYLFTQNYNSVEYLENYSGEVLIIHGDKDRIINNNFGKELFEILRTDDKEFYEVEGGNHNNELYIKGVDDKIIEFLK